MNKKGFTLVEIIICIAIIAVIGTISFVGFNIALKNIRINKLKDIEDEIMTAAKIYLETNDTAQTQLYKNENAAVIPLNVLVNEGLLDLSMTDLDLGDVGDEYVVAALATRTAGSTCVNITEGSWNLSKDSPLYICTDNSTGNSNLTIINPSSGNNADKTMQEPFVFRGEDPNNYVMYNGNGPYRIYYIDTDDSIVLVNADSFGNIFNGKTDSICGIPIATTSEEIKEVYKKFVKSGVTVSTTAFNNCSKTTADGYGYYKINEQCYKLANIYSEVSKGYGYSLKASSENNLVFNINSDCIYGNDNKEKYIWLEDYFNTYIPRFKTNEHLTGEILDTAWQYSLDLNNAFLSNYFNLSQGIGKVNVNYGHDQTSHVSVGRILSPTIKGYKIRLDSCMKIKSGTGAYQEPYILDDSKC